MFIDKNKIRSYDSEFALIFFIHSDLTLMRSVEIIEVNLDELCHVKMFQE